MLTRHGAALVFVLYQNLPFFSVMYMYADQYNTGILGKKWYDVNTLPGKMVTFGNAQIHYQEKW